MVGALLLRGMLVGVLAGLLCFGFLKIAGEPSVDRAIAFESQLEEAKAHAKAHSHGTEAPKEEPYPELVSRGMQAGLGLFTGVVVYSAAFGGLFALAFAFFYGRIGDFGPRATAALLAAMGIVAVYIVPTLKYPASPPSVGDGETIGMRTALYFGVVAISLAAMIVAGLLEVPAFLPLRRVERLPDRRRRLSDRDDRRGPRLADGGRGAGAIPRGGLVAVPHRVAGRAGDHVGDAGPRLRRADRALGGRPG